MAIGAEGGIVFRVIVDKKRTRPHHANQKQDKEGAARRYFFKRGWAFGQVESFNAKGLTDI
ncbi:hypothetical protein UR09_05650 [Candidatus Nitromaritima sp. SCGC AAA799-A02]|nr:hypothetical protein UR09_05650 [Candidatus Nitromaritima sp. SCGC AAA799-A02]